MKPCKRKIVESEESSHSCPARHRLQSQILHEKDPEPKLEVFIRTQYFNNHNPYELITRPSDANAASCTASCIVGCACTVAMISSVVASRRRPSVSSAINSVA